MLNRLKTETITGSCRTLEDGRTSSIRVVHFTNLSSPLQQRSYKKLLKNGAVSQSGYTMQFNCVGCNQCKPLRINTSKFRPSREQRKIIKRNRNLSFSVESPAINNEYYSLFKKYINARHPTSYMSDFTPDIFRKKALLNTHIATLKDKNTLVGFGLLQIHGDMMASEYVVFDPDLERQSLGNFLDLKLIEHAQRNRIKHIYLGEVNLKAQNLSHKAKFHGSEVFSKATGKWIPIERNPASLDHIP